MVMKKTISVLCSAAVLLTSFIGGNALLSSRTVRAEGETVGEEEPARLAVPQNLRYENGDIVWDEVEGAYGYHLNVSSDNFEYPYWLTYYVNRVELDRLCYEFGWDFGEYTFEVEAFDQEENRSDFSEPVTAEYAPTIEAPQNVRVNEYNEKIIEWDEVEGAYRYNIKCYNADGEISFSSYSAEASYHLPDWLETGDHSICVQTMDQEYNVSKWTEPIVISYKANHLDTPQNIRFDESGDNIVWDKVEGTDYYHFVMRVETEPNEAGNNIYLYKSYIILDEPCFENWKIHAAPFADANYTFYVYAHSYDIGIDSSFSSDELTTTYTAKKDESIKMPSSIEVVENREIKWDAVENASEYYVTVSVNGDLISEASRYYAEANEYNDQYGYNYYSTLPYGEYEVNLYVVDKNGCYNTKTYTVSFGCELDDSIWIPELMYKFKDLLWDYDSIRHDNTRNFWVRIRDAENKTAVRIEDAWGGSYYGIEKLPNGKYIVDVCVIEHNDKVGPWSNEIEITVHDGGTYDKGNEVSTEVVPEDTDVPEEDRVTTVTVNPETTLMGVDENGYYYELDLSNIKIQASEIYDEEGLKRAEEALGEALDGNTRYNLLDLTLLYNGEDFSNGYEGLVQVIISLPQGHLGDSFSVYRIVEDENGNPVKEEIPGERVGDTYVIYLEHFSKYALVGVDPHEHVYGDEWKSDEDGHWQVCEDCEKDSEKAEHKYGEWKVTKEATETEEGSKERLCETCGYKQTEVISKLAPEETEKPDDTVSDGKNPGTGAAVTGISALVLSACGAAAAFAVKKRNKK